MKVDKSLERVICLISPAVFSCSYFPHVKAPLFRALIFNLWIVTWIRHLSHFRLKISRASARGCFRIYLVPQLSVSLFSQTAIFREAPVCAISWRTPKSAVSPSTPASVTAVTQRACIIHEVGILFQLAAFISQGRLFHAYVCMCVCLHVHVSTYWMSVLTAKLAILLPAN